MYMTQDQHQHLAAARVFLLNLVNGSRFFQQGLALGGLPTDRYKPFDAKCFASREDGFGEFEFLPEGHFLLEHVVSILVPGYV